MSLAEKLQNDLNESMKAGDTSRTGVIRLLRSSMKYESIKLGHELSDAECMTVLQREAKQRKDSITQYDAAGREDLSKIERSELEAIEGYLPQPLTSDELNDLITQTIVSLNANGPSAMGSVIGAVKQQAGARADGALIAAAVKAKLAS